MIEHNFHEPNIVKNSKSAYFVHYMSKDKLTIHLRDDKFVRALSNYEELSKNDWELHLQLIREGHNPNEIAKIIRNDEIEKLQEISSQNDFNFNQTIESSLHERCSFINTYDIGLITYSAFFGSIKCFKYLLMNGANVENTGKYAVACGNEEIIHLCEQNHASFECAYETAIKYHRNDIFKYFYDNKLKEINNLEELGVKCILYHNYEIFSFLLKEGMKINDDIINEAAIIGNIFLVEYFLKDHSIPHDILVFSAESVNIELVEYVLKQKGIDINASNICLFYLKFIIIISYFKIIFGNFYMIMNLNSEFFIDIISSNQNKKTYIADDNFNIGCNLCFFLNELIIFHMNYQRNVFDIMKTLPNLL